MSLIPLLRVLIAMVMSQAARGKLDHGKLARPKLDLGKLALPKLARLKPASQKLAKLLNYI